MILIKTEIHNNAKVSHCVTICIIVNLGFSSSHLPGCLSLKKYLIGIPGF